jgi:rhamnosyltransferase
MSLVVALETVNQNNNMVKFAAVIILFNPDKSVLNNIKPYQDKVSKLYIIDNSIAPDYQIESFIASSETGVYIHDGANMGIAARLNQACELAINDGFEFLLTMDQDSSFEAEMLSQYLNCVSHYSDKTNVSMFGINHTTPVEAAGCSFYKVHTLITSGSIINLSIFKKINGFNEQLFIDLVDFEYCFKSVLQGYEVILFSNIFMNHQIGESSSHWSLKNLQASTRSFHSELRLYYMLRNYLYMKKIYEKEFKKELDDYKKDLFHRIKNNLLYKSHRLQTLQLLLKAWKDFRSNKMGKLN